jgi:phosphatidylserine decarboxylase
MKIITTFRTNRGAVVVLEQIGGLFTPKITNHLKVNQSVNYNDRIGKIYLGSRSVLHLPKSHYNPNFLIEKIGDYLPPTALIYQA